MIKRKWDLEVISKREATNLYELQLAQARGEPDFTRPYWIDKADNGRYLTLEVTEEEYNNVTVGHVITVELIG